MLAVLPLFPAVLVKKQQEARRRHSILVSSQYLTFCSAGSGRQLCGATLAKVDYGMFVAVLRGPAEIKSRRISA